MRVARADRLGGTGESPNGAGLGVTNCPSTRAELALSIVPQQATSPELCGAHTKAVPEARARTGARVALTETVVTGACTATSKKRTSPPTVRACLPGVRTVGKPTLDRNVKFPGLGSTT